MMPELNPQQIEAIGQMPKAIHDSYRHFGYAGIDIDPIRYLALFKQTDNHGRLKQVVNDRGIFFLDGTRDLQYRLNPLPTVLVYSSGFTQEEEKKLLDPAATVITMDRGLRFWNWSKCGVCLVTDITHQGDFLLPEYRKEFETVQTLQSDERLTIRPMLFDKKTTEAPKEAPPGTTLIDMNKEDPK